ncbi:MAG: phytanoyl-CoA dioxygenase family protein [Candidatus Latescibacteria bacterium]|nr:phytanoyl-CoA dioxygenase family protein [Candidatus Latescibacterota bacterium]
MITNKKTHEIDDTELAFYRENGYLLAKGVFNREEAAVFREETHTLSRRLMSVSDPSVRSEGWTSGSLVTDLPRELLHCHNVQFHSAVFSRLICDPRLTDRAADIIGANVQLHHTKMFIKPPERGAPFPMHQDYPYFPHENHTMIAATIHFDDAPIEKGCIRVVPGSFKNGPYEHIHEGGSHLPVEEYPVAEATPCPAEAGDVLFFSYLTIHGSGLNTTNEPRTTLLVQMRDPSDRPLGLQHLSRGQGMMLRGIDPEADSDAHVTSESRYLSQLKGT